MVLGYCLFKNLSNMGKFRMYNTRIYETSCKLFVSRLYTVA